MDDSGDNNAKIPISSEVHGGDASKPEPSPGPSLRTSLSTDAPTPTLPSSNHGPLAATSVTVPRPSLKHVSKGVVSALARNALPSLSRTSEALPSPGSSALARPSLRVPAASAGNSHRSTSVPPETSSVQFADSDEVASKKIDTMRAVLARFTSVFDEKKPRVKDAQGEDLYYMIDWPLTDLQDRIWVLLEVPGSSIYATIIYVFLMATILVSIIGFVIGTMELLQGQSHQDNLDIVEWVCTTIFGIEYIVRFTVTPSKPQFFMSLYNLVDFLAIMPTILEQILQAYARTQLGANSTNYSSVTRDLRLLRMLRLLKFAKTYSGIHIAILAIERSAQAVGMLLFFLAVSVVVYSSLLWFCERETGEPGFTSIPVSMWWGIVTMATVGYGDVVPTTPQGRWVGGCAIITALLLLSLPIAVIGDNFVKVLDEYNRQHEELMEHLKESKRSMHGGTGFGLHGTKSIDIRINADGNLLKRLESGSFMGASGGGGRSMTRELLRSALEPLQEQMEANERHIMDLKLDVARLVSALEAAIEQTGGSEKGGKPDAVKKEAPAAPTAGAASAEPSTGASTSGEIVAGVDAVPRKMSILKQSRPPHLAMEPTVPAGDASNHVVYSGLGSPATTSAVVLLGSAVSEPYGGEVINAGHHGAVHGLPGAAVNEDPLPATEPPVLARVGTRIDA